MDISVELLVTVVGQLRIMLCQVDLQKML